MKRVVVSLRRFFKSLNTPSDPALPSAPTFQSTFPQIVVAPTPLLIQRLEALKQGMARQRTLS